MHLGTAESYFSVISAIKHMKKTEAIKYQTKEYQYSIEVFKVLVNW